jgi:glutathione S-transferase
MKLYGTATSPYVRKLRILASEKALPMTFVAAAPGAPDGVVAALNPLGKVPVLALANGEVLFDSPVIMEYLDSLGSPALLPSTGDARWRVQRWHALAQGMIDATVARLLETRRPAEKQWPESLAKQEAKINSAMGFAAEKMPPQDEFLVDNRFSFADIAMGVALAYVDFRWGSEWRQRHGELSRWASHIAARPSFRDTQPPA